MKPILVAVVALSLGGCGWWERVVATNTGWSEQCVKGVLYYQFTSGAAVAYTPEGKVVVCK